MKAISNNRKHLNGGWHIITRRGLVGLALTAFVLGYVFLCLLLYSFWADDYGRK